MKKYLLARYQQQQTRFFPIEFMNDFHFVSSHLERYGYGLSLASDEVLHKYGTNLIEKAIYLFGKYSSQQQQQQQLSDDICCALKRMQGSCLKTWKDHSLVKQLLVHTQGCAFPFVSDEMRNDEKVVLTAVKSHGTLSVLDFASERLKKDPNFMLQVIQSLGPSASIRITDHSPELMQHQSFLRKAVSMNIEILANFKHNCDQEMDKDLVLTALPYSVLAMKHVPEEWRKSREFILEAIQRNYKAIEWASDELKNDCEMILTAFHHATSLRPFSLAEINHSSSTIITSDMRIMNWNDKHMTLPIVKEFGFALQHVSEELRQDRQLVLAAVSQHGLALQYASQELRNDKEIVLQAVKTHPGAMKYASNSLKNDISMATELIQRNNLLSLKGMSKSIWTNREIVLQAVKRNPILLKDASAELKQDNEIVYAAAEKSSLALSFASPSLKSDKSFMMRLVTFKGQYLQHASNELKRDKEIVLSACQQDSSSFSNASLELKKDRDFLLQLIKHVDARCMAYASRELQNDRDFILQAVRENGSVLQELWGSIYNHDRELIIEAVKSNGFAFKFDQELHRIRMEECYCGVFLGEYKRSINNSVNDIFNFNH
ncbi:hypothetical protein FDP41_009867 [Naegleria fowleri]|uniref:DUF4116 domain-containing protein n=1 Tax=Naegleria fowleri TaxID=5763 RepID=A0A6A5BC07_NAEFO|nr:uncharacterized protein FDP41_009867 [Naegleria fowleri]KAF0971644.1 hypothetical protein FDP41_009867 [Naegleria fowleri]CAG4719357.1 unnamed protein product [Naegleria fowleri]